MSVYVERIAVARAPKVLLLDEAISALDFNCIRKNLIPSLDIMRYKE